MMIEIDGSHGEGGGQILRTALSLSCLHGKPFRIYNVRKGRARPGLMPQHLMAVRAAQHVSRAEVTGDRQGSTEIAFSPGRIAGGDFRFDIGTAGATSLVLQTIIPALLFCGQESTITLTGGTHVPFSPPYDYLADVFAPFLQKLGVAVHLEMKACGFYPKGGGRITAVISPGEKLIPVDVVERGRMLRIDGCSAVGNLPLSIAERQKAALLRAIESGIGEEGNSFRIDVRSVPTPGTGTFVFVRAQSEQGIGGFTSIGARGKRAEVVGEEVAREFLAYFETGKALDPHLADQVVLYLSLCEKGSSFTTSSISRHLLTNLWVIGLFHRFRYKVEGETGEPGMVWIN